MNMSKLSNRSFSLFLVILISIFAELAYSELLSTVVCGNGINGGNDIDDAIKQHVTNMERLGYNVHLSAPSVAVTNAMGPHNRDEYVKTYVCVTATIKPKTGVVKPIEKLRRGENGQ